MPSSSEDRLKLLGVGPKALQRASIISAMTSAKRKQLKGFAPSVSDLEMAFEAAVINATRKQRRERSQAVVKFDRSHFFDPMTDEDIARVIEDLRGKKIGSK